MKNEILWRENASIREKYAEIHHQSGLTMLVFPKKLSTSYALFATRYGALDNCFAANSSAPLTRVPDGIAHFLEHKMFESEDGTDVFARFASCGANANAYTTPDMTAYLFSCTDHFAESLEILLDFVTHPYFTPENVEKEMGIISQEIGMYDDAPGSRLYYMLLKCLYQKHNIRINVAGTKETIRHITPELLYQCYNTFYQMSNMALVVCGDVTPEAVLAVADRILPNQAPTLICRQSPEEPREVAALYQEAEMSVSRPVIAIGIKDNDLPADPEEREKRGICFDLMNDLCFGKSSPFYSRLYAEGIISDDFSADYEMLSTCAFNSIFCECDDPDRVLREVKARVEEMLLTPPDQKDFARLHRCAYADYLRGFDSTEDVANELLNQHFRGVDLLRVGDLIRSVTYEDVCKTMRDFYCDKEFAMAVIKPSGKE